MVSRIANDTSAALLCFLVTLGGCGKELTAGGRQQVEVVATDGFPGSQSAVGDNSDADQDPTPRNRRPHALRPSQHADPFGAMPDLSREPHFTTAAQSGRADFQLLPLPLEGTVQMRGSVAILHESDQLVQITPGAVTASVAIGSGDAVALGQALVRNGTYTRIRIAFDQVSAQIRTDVAPTSIVTTVAVEIGAQPLVVERDILLEVGPRSLERIEIDLNTSGWAVYEIAGVVPGEIFAGSIDVRIR